MNVSDEPIYTTPELTAKNAKYLQQRLIEEGRAAFRSGLPISKCPPFKDPDMAIDWRNGWRWESETNQKIPNLDS